MTGRTHLGHQAYVNFAVDSLKLHVTFENKSFKCAQNHKFQL